MWVPLDHPFVELSIINHPFCDPHLWKPHIFGIWASFVFLKPGLPEELQHQRRVLSAVTAKPPVPDVPGA